MKACVICCNDAIAFTVIAETEDDKAVQNILEALAEEDYKRHPYNFGNDYAYYRDIYYWHVHATPFIDTREV